MTTDAGTLIDVSAARLGSARRGVYAIFLLSGLTFMSFVSRLPDVRHELGLSPREVGRILLATSVGSLIGLPSAGRLCHRFGTGLTVRAATYISTAGVTLAGFGVTPLHSVWTVRAGLFLAGLAIGVWDVGMNLEGTVVERLGGKAIMPRFHAAFSVGTVIGALIASLLSAWGVPVEVHVAVLSVLILIAAHQSVRQFLPRSLEVETPSAAATAAQTRPKSPWTESRTLLIGVVTMIAAATEGTANDWMSLAMVDGHHLQPWAGVLGLATFLSFMTVGRIVGGQLLDRHGRVPVLRVMFATAVVGALLVVYGNSLLAYVGAALWGLGASLGFPVGMSASADDPLRASMRMSVVSTIAYTAFLAGPPLLGELGEHYGVLRALLVVGLMGVVAFVLVPVVRPLAPGADDATSYP